jgi:hypothetical protein
MSYFLKREDDLGIVYAETTLEADVRLPLPATTVKRVPGGRRSRIDKRFYYTIHVDFHDSVV